MFQRSRPADQPLRAVAITQSVADRELLKRIFQKAGWEIVFHDRIDAAQPQHAIVLYDRDLPGMDWRAAIHELAAGPHRPSVILASSVVDDYLWEEVIQLGGCDVLSKPFREEVVIHTVQFAWAAITKSLPSAPRTR